MLAAIYLSLTLWSVSVSGFLLDVPDGPVGSALQSLAAPPLRIGSFNIQVFGQSKYSKTDVRSALVQILSRYDLVEVLEIRDASQTVFEQMRLDLNRHLQTTGEADHYEKVVSARLGRTDSKEQYGFLYRPSRVTVTSTYQFVNTSDLFERPPFGVRFKSASTSIQDFAIIATHISPSKAVDEINNLTLAYETFQKYWQLDDILIAGDYNADCNYVTGHAWANVHFRQDSRFTWLVDDNVDTTVAPSQCSYDRFVVGGTGLLSALVPGSVRAYRYDEEMGFNKTLGTAISDHYPIELELQGKVDSALQQSIATSTSFSVTDSQPVTSLNSIRAIYRSPSCAPAQFAVKLEREGTHMDYVTAVSRRVSADQVVGRLLGFSAACGDTLSSPLISTVNAYMSSDYFNTSIPNVYGLLSSPAASYDVTITCHIVPPNVCEVTVSRQISGN